MRQLELPLEYYPQPDNPKYTVPIFAEQRVARKNPYKKEDNRLNRLSRLSARCALIWGNRRRK